MRKFSGITNMYLPEAVCSDNLCPLQMILDIAKNERNPEQIGNIQPYRTEHRPIFK